MLRSAILAATVFVAVPQAFADDMGGSMGGPAMAATSGYKFELVGSPNPRAAGKNVVSVQLVHGGKPVTGAIIIQSRADMGPIGMAAMTAPITPLGEQPPGTYRFEVANGPVWKKADNWALSFSAKVQGVAQTVSGSVIVKLSP